MVVVVLERGIVRHRIMVVEIGHREMVGGLGHLGMGMAERGRLGMETVERGRLEMGTEALVLLAMVVGLGLLGMEGELLQVELGHQVMGVERDRLGMVVGADLRLLLGQQHRRLVLHLRLVPLLRLSRGLHRRRDLRLGPRPEVLSRDIRKEERSRRNGLSRPVRGRADLAAIIMVQRHGRLATAARLVLAAEHVREANLDEALQT